MNVPKLRNGSVEYHCACDNSTVSNLVLTKIWVRGCQWLAYVTRGPLTHSIMVQVAEGRHQVEKVLPQIQAAIYSARSHEESVRRKLKQLDDVHRMLKFVCVHRGGLIHI